MQIIAGARHATDHNERDSVKESRKHSSADCTITTLPKAINLRLAKQKRQSISIGGMHMSSHGPSQFGFSKLSWKVYSNSE